MDNFNKVPKFGVDKSTNPPTIFLQCSDCGTNIRQLKPKEDVKVNRAYFCDSCDPGVIVLNPPKEKKEI